MEKEAQQDSLSTVTVKPDYAPSEVYSTEPPPAYHKPKSSSVQVARIAAVTVVVCSVVLGCFWLASAYVTANATCRQLEQELELLGEAADRFQQSPPQAEALVQDEPVQTKRHVDSIQKDTKSIKEVDNNIDNSSENSDSGSSSSDSDNSSSNESDDDEMPVNIRLPLQIALNHLEEALLDRNQKSRMNCIVEKKKAEEVVDHQPKHIRLPFGVNLTTDPRYERLSGERMVIICESGTLQRAQPSPQPQAREPESEEDSDDDSGEEDTVMIQPIMIPIPHTAFQTHMPVVQEQAPPQQLRPIQAIEMRPAHPMENMRPPMAPAQAVMHIQIQPNPQPQSQPPSAPQSDMPPNPIIQHIIQQIITQKIMDAQRMRQEQMRQEAVRQEQMRQESMRQEQMRQEMMRQAQMRQEAMRQEAMRQEAMRQEAMRQEAIRQEQIRQEQIRQEQIRQDQMRQEDEQQQQRQEVPEGVMRRIPIPEDVLTQLNRLPNNDHVIVAVSEPESTASSSSEEDGPTPAAPQEVRVGGEMRVAAMPPQMRQAYARAMPIPVDVQQPQQPQEQQAPQEPEAQADENRPHYVQPRSIPEQSS